MSIPGDILDGLTEEEKNMIQNAKTSEELLLIVKEISDARKRRTGNTDGSSSDPGK